MKDKLTSFYVPSNELQNNQISLSISTVARVRNILSKDSVTSNNQIRFLIQLDKNSEKQKNSLTLKNYFSWLTINLKNKKIKKVPMNLLNLIVDYQPNYFTKRLEFDLKINYRYLRVNEGKWILPLDIKTAVDNISNKLNTPENLIVSDVMLNNENDYKIKKIKDNIAEDADSFFVKTITKTRFDPKVGAVTDYQFGDDGIVKNLIGNEKVIFLRYVSFNGIDFNIDSSGQANNFTYEIYYPKKINLNNFFEYQVNYLKNDWNKIANVDTDIDKSLQFIKEHCWKVK